MRMRLSLLQNGLTKSKRASPKLLVSKSMEKTFRRMIERPSARSAYVKAEIGTALAHQIRALRIQRGWTQRELAKRLETSTSVVSRWEDPSYGKLSLQTMLDLARVFDIGLRVKFISLIDMVRETFVPHPGERYVQPFDTESRDLAFVADVPSTSAVMYIEGTPVDTALLRTEAGGGRLRLGRGVVLPVAGSNSISIKL